MKRQLVALIRHGDYHQLADTPSAFQPFALTDNGIHHAQQSAAVSQQFSQLQQIPIGKQIHCSTLLRAWQTAEVIRQQWNNNHSLVASDRLGERCVGSVANLSAATIERVMEDDPRYQTPPQGWKSDSHFRLPFPGAESLMEAGIRVANYLKQMVQPLMDRPCALHLVVGHGAAFRHAACHLGVLPFENIEKVSMYHDQPVFLHVDNDQRWHLAGGRWKPRQPFNKDMD
ncbi:MAG: histidine phosphatase family protein [Mariprofundales bacterium]